MLSGILSDGGAELVLLAGGVVTLGGAAALITKLANSYADLRSERKKVRALVLKHLSPNSGESLLDKVGSLQALAAATSISVDNMATSVRDLATIVANHQGLLEPEKRAAYIRLANQIITEESRQTS